jgi:hypothetical protein
MVRRSRLAAMTLAAVFHLASIASAQSVHWGAKAGLNSTSVKAVPDYYDSFLCCHPLDPDAMVDSTPGAGFTAGGFATVPIHAWLGLQGELLFSRNRHAVDLRPYEAIEASFTRDSVEAAGLVKLEFPVTSRNRAYVASGPVFGFRIGEQAETSEPRLVRGNPETDIYVVQILAYAAPELLRTTQTSIAVAAGWVYRRLLLEVRLTQGLQSIFKDREGIISGFVSVGGDEPTLRRVIAEFGPFLDAGKSRNLAVVAGFRF